MPKFLPLSTSCGQRWGRSLPSVESFHRRRRWRGVRHRWRRWERQRRDLAPSRLGLEGRSMHRMGLPRRRLRRRTRSPGEGEAGGGNIGGFYGAWHDSFYFEDGIPPPRKLYCQRLISTWYVAFIIANRSRGLRCPRNDCKRSFRWSRYDSGGRS